MPPELRSTIRIPAPSGRVAAVLRLGHEAIASRLINVSSGGFGVRVQPGAGVFVGMIAALGAQGAWHRVRVAHVREVDGELEIGLENQGSLPDDWHLRDKPETYRLRRGRALGGMGWSTCVTGALVALGLLTAYASWHWLPRLSRRAPLAKQAAAAASAAEGATVDAAQATLAAARKKASIRFSARILPDASALLSRSMRRRLEISDEQYERLAEIIRERDRELQRLYRDATVSDLSLLQVEIASEQWAASQKAWAVLSEAQRQRLAAARGRNPSGSASPR